MRSAITFAALFAGAYADYVITTKIEVSTVTVTLHGDQHAPTSAAAPSVDVQVQARPVEVQQAAHPAAQQASQPESSPSTSASSGNSALDAHNAKRAIHGVAPLSWDDNLANIASQQANGCQWGHQMNLDGATYGQNIAAGLTSAADAITDLFYNGEEPLYAPYYGQPNPPPAIFEQVGHFTQLVWKSTTSVGCATAQCSSGIAGLGSTQSYTVCNYFPPGNMAGAYGENVLPPQ